MKRLVMGIVCASLISTAGMTAFAADDTGNPGSLSKKDYQFVKTAASGGMAEVQAGQLAGAKSIDATVKQFGQQMVTDHSKANDELKALAAQKGATLSASPAKRDQKAVDKMAALTGDSFDRAYARDMVSDHQKDVKEFQLEAQKADDADLRAWAAKTLPTLEMHLQMATNMWMTVSAK
jgi:putative membrane protein